MTPISPEKGKETGPSIEKAALIVHQPQKLESLLETIDLIDTISERIGEDRSGDMGGTGAGVAATGTGTQVQISARDQAIANLPEPKIMQKQIKKHIFKEIKDLKKQVRTVSRISKPGAAYKLNELYARIRRLQGLLAEVLEASYEVLKRLFIRIVIDRQSVI